MCARFCVAFAGLLVSTALSAACVPQQNMAGQATPQAPHKVSAEELLDGDGKYPLVEIKAVDFGYDPNTAHQSARGMVDPDAIDRKGNQSYTKRADRDAVRENIHIRVLRMDVGRDFEWAYEGSTTDENTSSSAERRAFSGLSLPPSDIIPPEGMVQSVGRALLMPPHKPSGRSVTVASAEVAPHLMARGQMKAPSIQPPTAKPVMPQKAAVQASAPVSKEKRVLINPQPKQAQAVTLPRIVKQSPVANIGARVVGLRVGNHPQKTRLVFDMSGAVDYRSALIEGNRFLVLEIKNAALLAPENKAFTNHPLVLNYSARGHKNSTTFVVELKKAAQIAWLAALPPSGDNPYHRVVIDLKPL